MRQQWQSAILQIILSEDSRIESEPIEQSIESYWMLIIEIKRIFKMPTEYDEKYEALNTEYIEIKSKPGFTINDHVYRKFAPVQSAHEELSAHARA